MGRGGEGECVHRMAADVRGGCKKRRRERTGVVLVRIMYMETAEEYTQADGREAHEISL